MRQPLLSLVFAASLWGQPVELVDRFLDIAGSRGPARKDLAIRVRQPTVTVRLRRMNPDKTTPDPCFEELFLKRNRGELEPEIKTNDYLMSGNRLWTGLYRLYWKRAPDDYSDDRRTELIHVTGDPPVAARPPGDCRPAESLRVVNEQQHLRELEERVALSVVRIQSNWENDDQPEGGFGFFVNGNWDIATAAHVVIKEDGRRAAKCITASVYDPKETQEIGGCGEFEVLGKPFPEHHDFSRQLVLLRPKRIPDTPSNYLEIADCNRRTDGMTKFSPAMNSLRIAGWPDLEKPRLFKVRMLSDADPSVGSDFFSLDFMADLPQYRAGDRVDQGWSGAPLVDGMGLVWAVHVGAMDVVNRQDKVGHWAFDIVTYAKQLFKPNAANTTNEAMK